MSSNSNPPSDISTDSESDLQHFTGRQTVQGLGNTFLNSLRRAYPNATIISVKK
jgi:hypothetical protein